MREIDYISRTERKINGMYYVVYTHDPNTTDKEDSNGACVVMSPEGYILKQALDYLRFLHQQAYPKETIRKIASSICHYYNFLRLYNIEGNNYMSSDCLDKYIQYLHYVPNNLRKRLKMTDPIAFGQIEYLPVHPFVNENDYRLVQSLFKEWFTSDNVIPFYKENSTRFEIEKKLWRLSYESIHQHVSNTLDFIKWLSESVFWKHIFLPIENEVVEQIVTTNPHNKRVSTKWSIDGRIRRITKLKRKDNQIINNRDRIFNENELYKLFSSRQLNQSVQKKLFFYLMLFGAARESELLNLQINNVTIVSNKGKYSVCWEDLFGYPHDSVFRDIFIDKFLNFQLRIVKRPSVESTERRNKTRFTREITLKDYFDVPEFLNLKKNTVFIDPKDVIAEFQEEAILRRLDSPLQIVSETMEYHAKQKRNGVPFNQYEGRYQVNILKLRSIIDKSFFGQLLCKYLIERHLLFIKHKLTESSYLFVNMKRNKGKPISPKTIRDDWFNRICKEQDIVRSDYKVDKRLSHNYKNTLTVHSFRHTYITFRIYVESQKGVLNMASLRKEVGHVEDSYVTECVYFILDRNRVQKGFSRLYQFVLENVTSVNESNTGEDSHDEENNEFDYIYD